MQSEVSYQNWLAQKQAEEQAAKKPNPVVTGATRLAGEVARDEVKSKVKPILRKGGSAVIAALSNYFAPGSGIVAGPVAEKAIDAVDGEGGCDKPMGGREMDEDDGEIGKNGEKRDGKEMSQIDSEVADLLEFASEVMDDPEYDDQTASDLIKSNFQNVPESIRDVVEKKFWSKLQSHLEQKTIENDSEEKDAGGSEQADKFLTNNHDLATKLTEVSGGKITKEDLQQWVQEKVGDEALASEIMTQLGQMPVDANKEYENADFGKEESEDDINIIESAMMNEAGDALTSEEISKAAEELNKSLGDERDMYDTSDLENFAREMVKGIIKGGA